MRKFRGDFPSFWWVLGKFRWEWLSDAFSMGVKGMNIFLILRIWLREGTLKLNVHWNIVRFLNSLSKSDLSIKVSELWTRKKFILNEIFHSWIYSISKASLLNSTLTEIIRKMWITAWINLIHRMCG